VVVFTTSSVVVASLLADAEPAELPDEYPEEPELEPEE